MFELEYPCLSSACNIKYTCFLSSLYVSYSTSLAWHIMTKQVLDQHRPMAYSKLRISNIMKTESIKLNANLLIWKVGSRNEGIKSRVLILCVLQIDVVILIKLQILFPSLFWGRSYSVISKDLICFIKQSPKTKQIWYRSYGNIKWVLAYGWSLVSGRLGIGSFCYQHGFPAEFFFIFPFKPQQWIKCNNRTK